MLEALSAKNFQVHDETVVDLNHSITTITGPTDSGKSSLLRLLRWIACNEPQGDGFVKEGTDGTVDELIVDGHRIVRSRGKNDNTYSLDGKEFKAFGTNVPEEIAKLLNVGPNNFQDQFDPVFWFSQTAGEVSRQLNSIVDLGVIDSTLANIAAKLRTAQAAVQVAKNRLQESTARFDAGRWVEDADLELREVEEKEKALNAVSTRLASITEFVQRYQEAEKTRHTATCIAADARSVGLLGVNAKNLVDHRQKLLSLTEECQKQEVLVKRGVPDHAILSTWLESWNVAWSRLRRLEFLIIDIFEQRKTIDEGSPEISVISQLCQKWQDERPAQLRKLIGDIRQQEQFSRAYTATYEKAEDELAEFTKDKCPVCGREWDGTIHQEAGCG